VSASNSSNKFAIRKLFNFFFFLISFFCFILQLQVPAAASGLNSASQLLLSLREHENLARNSSLTSVAKVIYLFIDLFIYYDNRAQGTNTYTSRKHKSISLKAQIKAIQTDRTVSLLRLLVAR
jgi:hypothetical protein